MTFKEGLQLVKTGDYHAAVQKLRDVIAADDQHHNAWNALGFALTRLGQYDEADDCYQAAIRIKPDEAVYLKNHAVNVKKRGVNNPIQIPSELLPPLKEKKTPDNTLITILGVVFFVVIIGGCITLYGLSTGMFTQSTATEIPQSALPMAIPTGTVQPDLQYESICTEGNEQIRQGQPEAAFKTFENATHIDSGAPKAWTGMGFALIELGRYESAIEAFETALKRDPNYQDARAGRQISSEALGKPLSGETQVFPAPASNCPQCTL
jgi:tetratricopeptide (TPR) repeat protein